jgi:hypothetical protein
MSLSNILKLTSSILGEVGERAQIVGLSRLMAEMKYRVFNEREATDGNLLNNHPTKKPGYRSESHKKFRQTGFKRGKKFHSGGRQILYKDLEITSELRNSIVLGKSGGQNVMGFNQDKTRLIAEHQETNAQTGRQIWTPNQKETDLAIESYNDEITFALKQGLSNV